jgi:thymidylate kinase
VVELIVVTGPIGAGKNTVSEGLAAQLRSGGRSAAVADLDDVVEMETTWSELSAASWRRAQRVHGALVGAWLRSGIDTVIAHGPFFSADDRAALLADTPQSQAARWVLLLASFEVAVERVKRDSDRNLSTDPEFLRAAYRRFDDLRADMPACEWVFDTTRISAEEIITRLASNLTDQCLGEGTSE